MFDIPFRFSALKLRSLNARATVEPTVSLKDKFHNNKKLTVAVWFYV